MIDRLISTAAEQLDKQSTASVPLAGAKDGCLFVLSCFLQALIPLTRPHSAPSTSDLLRLASETLDQLLSGHMDPARRDEVIKHLLTNSVSLQTAMLEDAHAIYEGDPAAHSVPEILITYPGFYATAVYRIAHLLFSQGVPFLPRIMTEHAHSITGIDIHPGATIGSHFFIDHGTGIVIGETTEIGNRVKLYQGVSLGALSVQKTMASQKRHPTIEDDVVIYAHATILGGKTEIGHSSIIGGNVWLTSSVPPRSIIQYEGKAIVRTSKDSQDFSI